MYTAVREVIRGAEANMSVYMAIKELLLHKTCPIPQALELKIGPESGEGKKARA
jgi:hypothetical protein